MSIEEIQLTARAPREDLAAPLVGGRDFVRDRIELELATAEERLAATEAALEEARRRHDVGIIPRTQLLEAEAGLAAARADFEILVARAELREAAVARSMSSRELAERAARLEIATRLRMTERLRELAAQQAEEARRRAAVGSIEEVDRLRAELELAEREVEIERLRAQIEALSPRAQ
jgi:outer membrane protein TolC